VDSRDSPKFSDIKPLKASDLPACSPVVDSQFYPETNQSDAGQTRGEQA
jgi:hypothetical protein